MKRWWLTVWLLLMANSSRRRTGGKADAKKNATKNDGFYNRIWKFCKLRPKVLCFLYYICCCGRPVQISFFLSQPYLGLITFFWRLMRDFVIYLGIYVMTTLRQRLNWYGWSFFIGFGFGGVIWFVHTTALAEYVLRVQNERKQSLIDDWITESEGISRSST